LDINKQLNLLYLGITQKLYSCSRPPFGPKTGKNKKSSRVVLEQYVTRYIALSSYWALSIPTSLKGNKAPMEVIW
jgi:hypothetical protein